MQSPKETAEAAGFKYRTNPVNNDEWNGVGAQPARFSNSRDGISRNERDRKRKQRKAAKQARKRNRG